MSEINIEALREVTRRAQLEKAQEIIGKAPEIMRKAAENAEAWTVIFRFFVVPGLGRLSFDGKLANLTGVEKLLHSHLAANGLNPGFASNPGEGTLSDGSSFTGISFRLVARWDTAPADNEFRQIYEAAVQARAKAITDTVPQLVAEASANGGWSAIVHSFFASADLGDLGFNGHSKNLKGVPGAVWDYLSRQRLRPFLFDEEERGTIGGCPWDGRRYFMAVRWHDFDEAVTAGG